MFEVLLGMGSNIEPEYNLTQAAEALKAEFSVLRFSPVYQSSAIGMCGDDFLNACCLLRAELSEHALRQRLKQLEDVQGRDRSAGSWKPRTLDLDILIYDGQVVDDELHRYAHACVPASDIVNIDLPDNYEGVVKPVGLCL